MLPNIKRNRVVERKSLEKPVWLIDSSSNLEVEEEEEDDDEEDEDYVYPIGKFGGWASIATVDWTEPLSDEVSSMSSLDWIIASDCVWLRSMLDSLLDTVASLFELNPNARLILSFQRRDSGNNQKFSNVSSIIESVERRKWSIDCLAWRHVRQDGEKELKEVFVFEIIPNSVA